MCISLLYCLLLFSTVDPITGSISPTGQRTLTERGYVRYTDFGAVGDGKTDDLPAIIATHEFANERGLRVRADNGLTFYIGGKDRTAVIKTDTDFGTAAFLIDDTDVENRNSAVFEVRSGKAPYRLRGINRLRANQERVALSLPEPSLITVTDTNRRRFIRYGLNRNNGTPQTDIFVVDTSGYLDENAPIVWDFEQVTAATALPLDDTLLTIRGGTFTTLANREKSEYRYFSRNISISRSNVSVDGLTHRIDGEGERGAPYRGFLTVQDCANVTVRNSIFTGHKTYRTIGSAGRPVSMGSYDLSVKRAVNVSFINCRQTNDIDDDTYWGLFASNYSKNILFDSCAFSRFDAHQGVANATIRNSTLGYMGIKAIGRGVLTIENTTVRAREFVQLRQDYGSTWEGDVVIRNCVFLPTVTGDSPAPLIGGFNDGRHDFGYTCYLPERVLINSLFIDDSGLPEAARGGRVFDDFAAGGTDDGSAVPYPIVPPKLVRLRGVRTASGRELRLGGNEALFSGVRVMRE